MDSETEFRRDRKCPKCKGLLRAVWIVNGGLPKTGLRCSCGYSEDCDLPADRIRR